MNRNSNKTGTKKNRDGKNGNLGRQEIQKAMRKCKENDNCFWKPEKFWTSIQKIYMELLSRQFEHLFNM